MSDPVLYLRVQDQFWCRIEELIFLHATPWELDEILCDAGFKIGPCEAQDLVGLEKVLARAPDRPTPVLPRMVAEGRLGKIGGVGFYRYPGGGGAVIDPLIEDLIREEAWFAKAERHEFTEAALIDEVSQSLVALRARLGKEGLTNNQVNDLLAKALEIDRDAALLSDL